MSSADLAELEGVSASRSHQLVAGAVVAHEAMTALGLDQVEVCPWALREGIILGRLDQVQPSGGMASVGGPLATGRPTLREAR